MMTDQRISPEELNAKLANLSIPEKDLARYFLLDEDRSQAFKPVLQLNPQTVALPDDPKAARARSEAAMTFANNIARMRRLLKFERMVAGEYTGPIIVSEGDSWFQFPILLDDTIDHLYDRGFAIRSLDAAGDTLENILAKHEYMDEIKETGASIFLLSAGGNDAVGGGNLTAHLRDFDPALSPAAHLLPSFNKLLDRSMAMYERVLREVEAIPGVVTICHGYDNVIPNAGKWLGKPMISRGITDSAFQQAISKEMLNEFNDRLRLLVVRFGARVVYVDARGAVGTTLKDWHDELHPKNEGYSRVAALFADAIAKVPAHELRTVPRSVSGDRTETRSRSLRPQTVSNRRGWSLHIGMNKIDPGHYGDEGKLFACHFDAEDMAGIARERGFEKVELMLDDQATREAVKAFISNAAENLKAGDTFFFTYAGHGSQVPDFNADESDGADETLCLYNGMLIDDELYELWSRFADDVRIVMISDSCHSGTVLRNLRRTAPENTVAGDGDIKSRLLPLHIAARTFRDHRDFYTAIGRKRLVADDRILVRELDMPLRGPVLLISGCQDNQESQDGIGNGRFTQELLLVWNEGRFNGDWRELHRRIVAGMPPSQTPNLMLIGRSPETLAAMPPFSI
jgi:lysophospholipase L1-like esterase